MSAALSSWRISRRPCRGGPVCRRASLLADQRGAVAFEMPFVFLFLMMSLLLPLADVAIAGFQYISAWQALRAFGQSIQYSPPSDVTNASAWKAAAIAKADSRYQILDPISLLPGIQVLCDGAACNATNAVTSTYKNYSFATTVTLAPMVLSAVLCTSSNADPCKFTLPYSERFQ